MGRTLAELADAFFQLGAGILPEPKDAVDAGVDFECVVFGQSSAPVPSAVTAAVVVDDADADRMLASLSGRTHRVVSGVAIALNGQTVSCTATSHVTLRTLTDAERAAYIASGEPTGKAGAYAIQGLGAVFIARLDGSYSSVMGLPLFETARLLKAAGVDLLSAS